MAQVSDWSTLEQNNVKLDDLTLSGEGGLYSNKIMCAVKAKFDDVDGKLAKVQGAYVFKGTKADMTALEAVTSPSVGDVYSVTALGGENYAWDGTAWDSLGTSDANVVHKTGDEDVDGVKTFKTAVHFESTLCKPDNTSFIAISGGGSYNTGARLNLYGKDYSTAATAGSFALSARTASDTAKELKGYLDGTLSWDGQAIQTSSDARLKTAMSTVSEDVMIAWGDVCWGGFKFLDAVERKGESARTHVGVIAQQVQEAFEAKGLDACALGILCHDVIEDKDLWMVRYEEALAMEAAYLRWRVSDLEIYNQALGFVGTRTVASPNEHTPEAVQCELMWDRARRSTLRDFPYRFAVRRLRLPEKEMPDVYEAEWLHCYGIPDIVLKVVRVHDGTRRGVNKTPYAIQRGDEGEMLLTDVEQAMIDAVVDVEDITQWDDAFVAAMARKLACLICVPLTKGEGKLQSLTQAYQAAIPVAEGADASESYDRKADDAWLQARGGW